MGRAGTSVARMLSGRIVEGDQMPPMHFETTMTWAPFESTQALQVRKHVALLFTCADLLSFHILSFVLHLLCYFQILLSFVHLLLVRVHIRAVEANRLRQLEYSTISW